MKIHRLLPITAVVLATFAGCSTMPPNNAQLDDAKGAYRVAREDPKVAALAGVEFKQAEDALNKADAAWTRKESRAEVDHLAYLAKQRVAIAQEVMKQKSAELAVADATTARDRVRLSARTQEAESAQRNAQASQLQADASQRQAEESQRQNQQAQRQAAASQQQTTDANARAKVLEAQLKDLNAKQTERGLVITIGDVLFDTNKSQLKPGGMRSAEKLGEFLKQFPQRTALIEGYTDSTGSEATNQRLSDSRANAVRMALRDLGIGSDRISTHGYGEAYPIASNDTVDGRQLNRRVEIVLSDEAGKTIRR